MLLHKYIIQPVDDYLNDWFNALPFEAMGKMFGIDLVGSQNIDELLDELKDEWVYMDLEEKCTHHDENWERYESYTQHLEIPHLIVRQKEWEY